MRLLSDGVSVARTATDLVRYHDKLMIIDNRKLVMMGFNYTYIDIERSRSFGIIANGDNDEEKQWVAEAEKLFLADATRQKYTPGCDTFLVSPGNSRKQLTQFIQAMRKKQLLIYDGKLSDPEMMKLLSHKAKHGVEVRVIGKAGKHAPDIKVAPLGYAPARAGHREGRRGHVSGQPEPARPGTGRAARGGRDLVRRRHHPQSHRGIRDRLERASRTRRIFR